MPKPNTAEWEREREAFWEARNQRKANEGTPLRLGGFLLRVSEPQYTVVCDDCGYRIRVPARLEYLEPDTITCSTCEAAQRTVYREKHLWREHEKPVGLSPPICDCGYTLDRCHLHTCLQEDRINEGVRDESRRRLFDGSKRPPPPPAKKQGSLF